MLPDLLIYFLHSNKRSQNNVVPVGNNEVKETEKKHSNTFMPTRMCSIVHWDVWVHCVVHCDVGGGHLTDGGSYIPG